MLHVPGPYRSAGLKQCLRLFNTVLKREVKIPTLITTGGRNRASNFWGGKLLDNNKRAFMGFETVSRTSQEQRGAETELGREEPSHRETPACRNEETHQR